MTQSQGTIHSGRDLQEGVVSSFLDGVMSRDVQGLPADWIHWQHTLMASHDRGQLRAI